MQGHKTGDTGICVTGCCGLAKNKKEKTSKLKKPALNHVQEVTGSL